MTEFLEPAFIPLSDSSFSVDINSPSKSLKGVLLIFTKKRSATKFNRDTEEFFNPKITKVEVTVEGVPNELYAQSMEYRHHYDEIMKHFGEGRLKEAGAIQKDPQLQNVNIASFYTDKYALLLDFRTMDDIIDSTVWADDLKTLQKDPLTDILKKLDQQENCLAICIYFRTLKLIFQIPSF